MAARVIDMAGKKYSSITAIRRAGENASRGAVWLCVCDCGTEFLASGNEVRRGKIKTCPPCGIRRKLEAVTTHGKTQTTEYAIWTAMKCRCYNENALHYADYGGRGIVVCDRWLNSFENFLADMGPRPHGMSIDRKENSGNYEPGNCRWATRVEQSNNRRSNHKITIDSITKNLAEWANEYQLSESAIRHRLRRGLSGAELVAPVFKTNLRKRKSV